MSHDQGVEPDEVEEPVYWVPTMEAEALDLAYALEHIRRAALIHFLGGAFDPRHMLRIADLATKALNGEAVGAPYDVVWTMAHSPMIKKMGELFDDDE